MSNSNTNKIDFPFDLFTSGYSHTKDDDKGSECNYIVCHVLIDIMRKITEGIKLKQIKIFSGIYSPDTKVVRIFLNE